MARDVLGTVQGASEPSVSCVQIRAATTATMLWAILGFRPKPSERWAGVPPKARAERPKAQPEHRRGQLDLL
jgi:hypothetical protein